MFSSIAGDSMQRVVLCSDWYAWKVKPNPSTHTEEHTTVLIRVPESRSAGKVACCVWTGGKSESSYLSVEKVRKEPRPPSTLPHGDRGLEVVKCLG